MVQYFFIILLFLSASLNAMEMSLRHTVLKNICKMVDENLSPELIHKLCTLPNDIQKMLCHYLLRADEDRRARYKELFKAHATVELKKKFDFSTLGLEGTPEMLALSSNGDRLFVICDSGAANRDHLYILNLLNNGEILHAKVYPNENFQHIELSPENLYYGITLRNEQKDIYDYSTFQLYKKGESGSFVYDDSNHNMFVFSPQETTGLALFQKEWDESSIDICLDDHFVTGNQHKKCVLNRFNSKYAVLANSNDEIFIYNYLSNTPLKKISNLGGCRMIFFDPYGLYIVILANRSGFVLNLDYLEPEPFKKESVWNYFAGTQPCVREWEFKTQVGLNLIKNGLGTFPYVCDLVSHREPGQEWRAYFIECYDVYSGNLEGKVRVDNFFSPAKVTNGSGNLIFIMEWEKGYLYEIKDFDISLVLLLYTMFLDQQKKVLRLTPDRL